MAAKERWNIRLWLQADEIGCAEKRPFYRRKQISSLGEIALNKFGRIILVQAHQCHQVRRENLSA